MTDPDLKTILSRLYTLRPFIGTERAYQYAAKTSDGTTLHLARFGTDGDHVSIWPCREGFDPALAAWLMEQVGDVPPDYFDTQPIRVLKGLSSPHRAFNQILLLGPEAHAQFEKTSEDLQAQTVVCFPAYDCEFTGDEEPSLVRTLRKYFVAWTDWGREPQPRILEMHRNKTTGSKSPGQKRGLGRLDKVLREIESLPSDAESFIEIENIRGTVARWTRDGAAYDVQFPESSRTASRVDPAEAAVALRKFLTEPAEPA